MSLSFTRKFPLCGARFFRPSLQTIVDNSKPPVLFLAEDHARPAVRYALTPVLQQLRMRGYSTFMSEGPQQVKTLQDTLQVECKKAEFIHKLYYRIPALINVMCQRNQFTSDEFFTACLQALQDSAFGTEQKDNIVRLLMCYDAALPTLYHELTRCGFNYKNLDEASASSSVAIDTSHLDLNRRDAIYVQQISDAYNQKQGVIVNLGGLHLLPDTKQNADKNFLPKQRKLIGERLAELRIPFIGLFPFHREFVPSSPLTQSWQKQTLAARQSSLDPSFIYAVDVAGNDGGEIFLQLIDDLIAALHVKKSESCRKFTKGQVHRV